jgi:hypothetical protein
MRLLKKFLTVGFRMLRDTWHHLERRMLDAAFVASVTNTSGDPAFWNNSSI